MMIGYARVSTYEQNLDRQTKLLKEYGCEIIIDEKVSGATRKDRKEFENLMSKLRFGDILVVTELSRLARSLDDLLNILKELQALQVGFISIKENIDTRNNTIYARFLMKFMGLIAEFERDLINERQKEGIAAAKKKGKYQGRPIQYHENATGKDKLIYDTIVTMLKQNDSVIDISKKTSVSRNTIYKIKKSLQE